MSVSGSDRACCLHLSIGYACAEHFSAITGIISAIASTRTGWTFSDALGQDPAASVVHCMDIALRILLDFRKMTPNMVVNTPL